MTTLLTPEETRLFEGLRKSTKDAAARKAIDDLLKGRTLERLLVAMQDDIEREEKACESDAKEMRPNGAREWCEGKAAGLRHARHRIARDNVVTVG